MAVIFALIVIGLPAAWVLAHILHFFSVGPEGIKKEWEEGKRQAEIDAQLARNSKEMQDRVDEIFRKQREEMGRRQKEREMRKNASNNGPTNNAT